MNTSTSKKRKPCERVFNLNRYIKFIAATAVVSLNNRDFKKWFKRINNFLYVNGLEVDLKTLVVRIRMPGIDDAGLTNDPTPENALVQMRVRGEDRDIRWHCDSWRWNDEC